MTVDVQFGKRYYNNVYWPNMDWDWPDRTNFYPRQPRRSFSIPGFYDWINRVPEARQLLLLCKPKYPETQDREYRKVDKELLDVINSLPEKGNPIDIDRAKWFKYWVRLAVEEFGENAYIQFS